MSKKYREIYISDFHFIEHAALEECEAKLKIAVEALEKCDSYMVNTDSLKDIVKQALKQINGEDE